MLNTAVDDELISNNAIYAPDTLVAAGASEELCILKVPGTDISLRVQFSADYPDSPPAILGPEAAGADAKKGQASKVVQAARSALATCFRPGEPCMFELIESLSESVQGYLAEPDHDEEKGRSEKGLPLSTSEDVQMSSHVPQVDPQWFVSDVVTEKKSVFVARCAKVKDPDEARQYVQHLVVTDKKASKATHNINAWRIKGPSAEVSFNDCDDDGESAAGGRLLHLLQVMDVWNVVIVVSRWYGGIHLGADRFKIINNVARDALIRSGIYVECHK